MAETAGISSTIYNSKRKKFHQKKNKSSNKETSNVTSSGDGEEECLNETQTGAKGSRCNGVSVHLCAETKYACAEVDITLSANGRSERNHSSENLSTALKSAVSCWSSVRVNASKGGKSAKHSGIPKDNTEDRSFPKTGENAQTGNSSEETKSVRAERKNARKNKRGKNKSPENRQFASTAHATDQRDIQNSRSRRQDFIDANELTTQIPPSGIPMTIPLYYSPPSFLPYHYQPVQYILPDYNDFMAMKLGHIRQLLETYFDDEHLFSHPYLRTKMDSNGNVHLSDCFKLPGILNITNDINHLIYAVGQSSVLELNNLQIRRKIPPATGWERLCLPEYSSQVPVLITANYYPQNFAYGQYQGTF